MSSSQSISDPTNLNFLVAHLNELPEDARKYILWASFFGETYAFRSTMSIS